MGLIALLFSVVADAIWPLRGGVKRIPADDLDLEGDTVDAVDRAHAPHPLQRPALRLIDWMSADQADPFEAGDVSAARLRAGRRLSAPGWIVVVGLPVLLVVLVQSVLGALAGFFVFALHVFVLYLTVGVGAFHRQFLELQLLIGAGEDRSARSVLARWIRSSGSREGAAGVAPVHAGDPVGATPAASSEQASKQSSGQAFGQAFGQASVQSSGQSSGQAIDGALPRAATAEALLAAYRDVFAPLFWYAILPGAIGPVLYLFARFAACHSHPFARTAYYWIDWLPLRVASMGLALAGQFEEAIFSLRAVNGARTEVETSADPYIHQRLLLLPVAGGALGLRLTDAALEARLRIQAPELDFPAADPEPPSLRPVAGLLVRSSAIWVGLYLLVKLLG